MRATQQSARATRDRPQKTSTTRPSPARRISGTRGPTWPLPTLIAAGLIMLVVLAVLVLLYVNFPSGRNVLYGLSRNSARLFRTFWGYPLFRPAPADFSIFAILTMLTLWGAYIVASLCVAAGRSVAQRRRMIYVIVAFMLAFNGFLVFVMPPVLSSDVYSYALLGRAMTFYGLNPYLAPAATLTSDPLLPSVAWREETAPYGPSWMLISSATAALAGQSALVTVVLFKGVAALFSLVNCGLVFVLARRLGKSDGVSALLLYAWNPLILIETAGSGHNDAVMVAFALTGLLLATKRRLLLGLTALMLSMLVKYVTALLLLFYVARCLVAQESLRDRAGLALRMAGVAAAAVVILYLPFWPGLDRLHQLFGGLTPYVNAVPNLPRVLVNSTIARLWLGGASNVMSYQTADAWVDWILHLAFGVLMVLLLRRAIDRNADWQHVLPLWGLAGLVYIFVVYAGSFPWYLISVLAVAAIGPASRWNHQLRVWSIGLGMALMGGYAVLV